MRRIGLLLVLCLAGTTTMGCQNGNSTFTTVGNKIGGTGTKTPAATGAALGAVPDAKAVPMPKGLADVDVPVSVDEGDSKKADPLPPALADAVVGKEKAVAKMPKQQSPPGGILTAGSFDDNVN